MVSGVRLAGLLVPGADPERLAGAMMLLDHPMPLGPGRPVRDRLVGGEPDDLANAAEMGFAALLRAEMPDPCEPRLALAWRWESVMMLPNEVVAVRRAVGESGRIGAAARQQQGSNA